MRISSDNLFYHYEAIHLYGLDVENREIYLNGIHTAHHEDGGEPGVEFQMANQLIRNLRILTTQKDKDEPILIHMKTCGGFWSEGMAIYDAISNCPCPVTILNYTHARSMSSIILQAADKRVMMPNSHFLFHYGSYGDSGSWKVTEANFEWTKKETERMIQLYVDVLMNANRKFKGWTETRLCKFLKDQMDKKSECYLTAEEAIEWGFADEIFDGDWSQLT